MDYLATRRKKKYDAKVNYEVIFSFLPNPAVVHALILWKGVVFLLLRTLT